MSEALLIGFEASLLCSQLLTRVYKKVFLLQVEINI
jgi:hypothetical protein